MTPDTLTVLRQAAEVVRAQIPAGGLTRASVEQLLQAAEAVCTDPGAIPGNKRIVQKRPTKRQVARQRWAEIARGNTEEAPEAPGTMP